MASTRNKNTPGDYASEQRSILNQMNYNTYEPYGAPTTTLFSGDGLLMGRIAPQGTLAGNACDIESSLFGIGSTNLVNFQTPVVPELYPVKSLSIIDRIPVLVPKPLEVQAGQRPLLQ